MRTRRLGRTELEVSEIAFGGVEIGMPYGIGVKSEKDMLSEEEAVHLLHAAVDNGINFFDTARLYGRSENIMGKAFKEIRERVIISTKCVHLKQENGKLPEGNILKKIIEDSLHESLKALQTDYVDVFMLHNGTQEILSDERIASVFLKMKKTGVTKAIGVSTYLPEETKLALDTGVWDVIQLPFNLLDQREKEVFALAMQRQVGIIVRSVLFKGLLSGRGKNLHPALKEVEKHIASYPELLGINTEDLSSFATKFVLSFKAVSSALIGIDRMEYLNNALQIADGNYLDDKVLLQAKKSAYPDPAFLNLPYWDKMGWLK
ncbi:MAG: aldo/keto reductase [Chitinophagaceae bacterium]|nr:MAG: aldo/keto reductase [Chitinophagaceae bacterium]